MRHTYPLASSQRSQSPSPSPLPTLGTTAATPQPTPSGDGQPVVDAVIADINARRDKGLQKYGTLLRTYNGRDALMDLYQELLDAVMYLRQFRLERDGTSSTPPNAVTEGVWSPVYDRNWNLSGHVTFVEGELYWRPMSKRIVSSADGAPATG